MVKLLLEHKASLTAEDKKQKIAAIHITVRGERLLAVAGAQSFS
jgi:hypothetical protein